MAEQIITLGIGPVSDLVPFITTGLEIAAVAALVVSDDNTVYVSFRDKRAAVKYRDKRVKVELRNKRQKNG